MNTKPQSILYSILVITMILALGVLVRKGLSNTISRSNTTPSQIVTKPISKLIPGPTEYIIDEAEITDQSEIVIPSDWKTYTDDKFGFQIRYPSDWFISVDKEPFPNVFNFKLSKDIRYVYIYNSKNANLHYAFNMVLSKNKSGLTEAGYDIGGSVKQEYWSGYKKFKLLDRIFWRGNYLYGQSYGEGRDPRGIFYLYEDKNPARLGSFDYEKSFDSIFKLNEENSCSVLYIFPLIQSKDPSKLYEQEKIDTMDKIVMSIKLLEDNKL